MAFASSVTASRAAFLLRLTATRALDVLYPPGCIACRGAVATHQALCVPCWNRVRFIERPYCERLGTPFAQDWGRGTLSPEAMADPPVPERVRAVAFFEEGPVRQMVHRLKYSDRHDVAAPMARWMARAGDELLKDARIIVSVPLHWRRLLGRRFNQAALLADGIARVAGVPHDPFALARRKPTPHQVGLSRAARAENMQGAFLVPDAMRGRVTGRRVLLVDDVITSGATLNAAARALLRGGATAVDALVFARVVTTA